MALQCASPKNRWPISNQARTHPVSWPFTSTNSPARITHSYSQHVQLSHARYRHHGITVLQLALRIAQPPCPRPRSHRFLDQRPIANQPWHLRARASAMEPFQPTASHTSWPSNGASPHMQALKPPAAMEWGLGAVFSLCVCLSPGLSRGLSEGTKAASRAGKKKQSVGRQRASGSVAPSRRNMQRLISSRLPLVGILVAYWLTRQRRHCPAPKRLAGCRHTDCTQIIKLTDSMPSSAHHHSSFDQPGATLLAV